MKSIYPFLLYFLFLLSFNGCEVCSCKKITCPAFNDPEFTNWFPYTPNQKIIFRNNSLTDTITVRDENKSASYEASKGCYNGANGCNMNSSIYSSEMQPDYAAKFSLNYIAQTPFESSVTSSQIVLRFYNFGCIASAINNQGLLIDPGIYSSHFHPTLTIAGNIYNNVQEILKDTSGIGNKTAGLYKIYIAKNQGIIGYEDYPALQQWVKE